MGGGGTVSPAKKREVSQLYGQQNRSLRREEGGIYNTTRGGLHSRELGESRSGNKGNSESGDKGK